MIIGLCGRVAAGKETLTKFLRDKGFIYFETRQIIIEGLKKLGLELSRENMQNWADDLRVKEGVGAVMNIMLTKANKDKTKHYIFDSLRNAGEAEFLRKELGEKNFFLIGVDAPQKLRFQRILSRGKESDPKNWEDFLKMDDRDHFDFSNIMGQQTGKLLHISDFIIVNDSSLESSMKRIEEIWKSIQENIQKA